MLLSLMIKRLVKGVVPFYLQLQWRRSHLRTTTNQWFVNSTMASFGFSLFNWPLSWEPSLPTCAFMETSWSMLCTSLLTFSSALLGHLSTGTITTLTKRLKKMMSVLKHVFWEDSNLIKRDCFRNKNQVRKTKTNSPKTLIPRFRLASSGDRQQDSLSSKSHKNKSESSRKTNTWRKSSKRTKNLALEETLTQWHSRLSIGKSCVNSI